MLVKHELILPEHGIHLILGKYRGSFCAYCRRKGFHLSLSGAGFHHSRTGSGLQGESPWFAFPTFSPVVDVGPWLLELGEWLWTQTLSKNDLTPV